MHTVYGHFQIDAFGEKYIFKPSFYNLSKIGNEHDLMAVLNELFCSDESHYFNEINPDKQIAQLIRKYAGKNQMSAAMLVLNACYEGNADISPLIGKYTFTSPFRSIYQVGFESPNTIIALSQHLIRHGMIGKSDNKVAQKSSKKITKFNPSEYVDMARLHLEMSRDEAWDLTMTEFLSLWLIKFPPDEKQQIACEMSKEEYAAEVAKLEAIRDKTLGSKK